ncbi:hypothetical protein [Mycobacterium sp. SMC-4]|uniref:hypothetical protein n=1 Tax=Mycobacterium sp. SMC-4 TaxID=2857059 RepID=UPI0021B41A95|nr:hypothetical protein [Mycobacterium sp. SMC-4]
MAGRIIEAPERALQHCQEAQHFVGRIILRSSGERRKRATHIAELLTSASGHLKILMDGADK